MSTKIIFALAIFAFLPDTPAAAAAAAAATAATCYQNNGAPMPPTYQPCQRGASDPLAKICCNIGAGDICLRSGVCQQNSGNLGTQNQTFSRDGCTEQDWRDGGCLNLCHVISQTNTQVTPCGDANNTIHWCCGDGEDCCSGAMKNRQTIAQVFNPTAQNPSPYSTSEPTRTGTAPATMKQGGLSPGAIAAIGVIGGFIGAALIAFSIFLVKARQWHHQAAAAKESGSLYSDPQQHEEGTSLGLVQLPGIESEVHEMTEQRMSRSRNLAQLNGVSSSASSAIP